MSKSRKKQLRKKQSREKPLQELARRRPFIDGYDLYADEYERWKRMDIVKRLIGVYELSHEQCEKDTQELLPEFGLTSHQQLVYDAEVDNSGGVTEDADDSRVSGSGWTSAVRDQYGRVRPVVFVRRDIAIAEPEESDDEKYNQEVVAAVKLLVLMHEFGHADDISRGVNYDHVALKLDIVAAEIYAHKFVMQHAKRLDYRLALKQYISSIEEHRVSENEAARLAAERLFEDASIEEYRRAARQRTQREMEQDINRRGLRPEDLTG